MVSMSLISFNHIKGKYYNSNVPPKHYAPNSSICKQYSDFIVKELMDKIQCGAIKLLGRVGECQPPRVVIPLTVEPSKPRLTIVVLFFTFK